MLNILTDFLHRLSDLSCFFAYFVLYCNSSSDFPLFVYLFINCAVDEATVSVSLFEHTRYHIIIHCMLYMILTTLYSYLLVHVVKIWLWLCDICPAREEEKLKMKKQNEALTAERKRLDQRAAQLAESLSVSDHCYPMSHCL